MTKLIKTEEQEQAALFEYASLQSNLEWQLLFAIPNGGFRSKRTGARMKLTGTKAGLPDIFLPVARGGYHGLFVEMKSEKGKVSEKQVAWHIKLREQGFLVEICRGCEEAVKTIRGYLNEGL